MADANRPIPLAAAAFTAALCAVFGANTVAIKLSLAGLGVFTTAGLRFCMAAVAIGLWARATGRGFFVPAHLRPHLLVVCTLFTLQLALFYLGLARTNASRGALIANAVPFIVLILAHFFLPDDRITARKLVGMLIGFAGVALVLTEGNPARQPTAAGDWIVLAAATLWAVNAVFTKWIIARFEAFHLVFYPMVLAGPAYLAAGWLWDRPMVSALTAPVIAGLLYQGLICAAFGFVAWTTLLQRYGASTLHAFVFIMPVAGVTAGSLVLGEPVTARLAAAVVLVAVGIATVYRQRPKPPPPTLPVGRGY